MAIDRKDVEVFDQPHQMFVEGTSTDPVNPDEVRYFVETILGYTMIDEEIWYDDLQGFYRWLTNIRLRK